MKQKKASTCHPERSEGSLVRARDLAGRPRSFAALRMTRRMRGMTRRMRGMTGGRVFFMACKPF